MAAVPGNMNPKGLSVIREEQRSPSMSVKIQPSTMSALSASHNNLKCLCGLEPDVTSKENKIDPAHIANLLKEKERELRAEYDVLLQKEMASVQARFDSILLNEQMRTSYMLREAHRERQEKIRALESQLHCKNLSALMYVMCSERTRSRLEKLQLIEDYTNYITGLHEILAEGQRLILHLSRGYKTAARVDYEWREKMTKVMKEFLNFIYHFAGGTPEQNQYFFDMPTLLKTETTVEDDLNEDPCEEEAVEEEEVKEEQTDEQLVGSKENEPKLWWELLEEENRPFIVFGDMADFMPPQRRAVLKVVKAQKTAPKVWKEYMFNGMSLKDSCENADQIKNTMTYPRFKPSLSVETSDQEIQSLKPNVNGVSGMTLSSTNRRQTALSVDIRGGDMGSILKIITLASIRQQPDDKTALLGVKDSLEVMSTTKLRQGRSVDITPCTVPDKLDIGRKHTMSRFDDLVEKEPSLLEDTSNSTSSDDSQNQDRADHDDDKKILHSTALGNNHNDSLLVIPTHVPDKDHTINYERICPVPLCQNMHVDSFMKTLPVYMRANPFTHFQQTFEEYEPCTKEQLEILKQRIEEKRPHDETEPLDITDESPLKEWETGMGTQTSVQSLLESCTCPGPNPTPADSNFIFNLQDLVPVKVLMDTIQKECLYDDRIDFDRFGVIGEPSINSATRSEKPETKSDFKTARANEISSILRHHPSLLDIFQANTRC